MTRFLLHHRHSAQECAAAAASWRGHRSPLRGRPAPGSCRYGGHEIWWQVDASNREAALAQLPIYVAERTTATRVDEVEIP